MSGGGGQNLSARTSGGGYGFSAPAPRGGGDLSAQEYENSSTPPVHFNNDRSLSMTGRKECLYTSLLEWGRMNLTLCPRMWIVVGVVYCNGEHGQVVVGFVNNAQTHIYPASLEGFPIKGLKHRSDTAVPAVCVAHLLYVLHT